MPSPSIALPAFAPDEPLFAWNRLTGAGGGLFVSKPDGTGMTQLAADLPVGVHKRIAWSPTGDRIAFIDEATGKLWIANLDGSLTTPVPICDTPGCDFPAFAPDGRHLAYSRNAPAPGVEGPGQVGLYVVDLAAGTEQQVIVLKRPNLADVPHWSPDGTRLVFQLETMDDRAFDTGSQVAIVPVAGGEPTTLTEPASFGTTPDWSWERDEIVFTNDLNGAQASVPHGLPSDVFVIRPDGTGLRQLTHAPKGTQYLGARWSPDGTAIYAYEGGLGAVRIDPASGALEPVSTPTNFTRPVPRPLP
jgi:TolB protein